MSIGAGIALIVIGAILAFAVEFQVPGIDLSLIGYILIGAGVIVSIIGLVLLMRRRQTDTVSRTAYDPAAGEQVTRQTTRRDDVI